jgi:NAD(P)-dependent dehydrogenase (short-subunit alcohol dehydrogenase family)
VAVDSSRKPALLVTSGGLYKEPFAPYFSLAVSKAAQHSLTISLNQAYGKQGVHVAAVVVHGLVKPDSEHFSPRKIAEIFWNLYEQGAENGEKEVWVSEKVAH